MLNLLFEFSRSHCLAICAFLVPANMTATLQTMIFIGRRSPENTQTRGVAPIIFMSIVYALTMIFHVFTWFVVGMVMAPTFILLSLGIVCLGINVWAIAFPATLGNLLRQIWQYLVSLYNKISTKSSSVVIAK